MPTDLAQKVIEIVREASELTDGTIVNEQTNFIQDLDIDSLTLIRIDMMIQAKLGLGLAPEDIEDVETVADLVNALNTNGRPV